MLDQNMNLDNFETINLKPQDNNYYSFIKKEELKKLFNNKIFI